MFLVVLVSALVCTGHAGELALGGYYKNFTVGYHLPFQFSFQGTNTPQDLGAVTNRLRADVSWRASRLLHLQAAANLVLRVQDPVLFDFDPFQFRLNPQRYRVDDPEDLLYPESDEDISSVGLFQNLDRLQANLRLPFADLYVGRQAIAWGFARVINPTDVVAPYAYTELDTEHRIGVDAVRARIPLGMLSELDVGWVFGSKFAFERSAGFLRGRFYVLQTDVSPIAVLFREHLMLGLSLARSIGGAGTWVEAAYTRLDDEELIDDETDDYWRVTIGADYSLTSTIYGFAEYHYNQPGASNNQEYVDLPFTTAYREGSVYLLGEHYLIPGASIQISPLVTLTAEFVANLSDPSLSLTPYLEYNIAENIYLAGGAFIGFGPGPSVDLSAAELGSEFGSYPDYLFTSFRIYY
ncbi:hypothetical protein GF356_06240 [candidate division GN15 bacterium]|nr:hypothetical protein [candidate division GN15 bacterium]